jgi:hypothetical protein
MAETNIETLDDGTVLTDEAIDKIVSDAYAAIEAGKYRVIPNPHKKLDPIKITDPVLRSKLEKILGAT